MNAWRILVATAALGAAIGTYPARAQHGPDYPSGSERGPAFPKSVAPTDSNPTNWVGSPSLHQDQGQSVERRRWERAWTGWRRWRD